MPKFRVKKDSIIPTPSGSSKRVKAGDILEGEYYLPMVQPGIVEEVGVEVPEKKKIEQPKPQALAPTPQLSADTSRCVETPTEKPTEKISPKRAELEQLPKAELLKMLPAEKMCGFKGDKNDLITMLLKG